MNLNSDLRMLAYAAGLVTGNWWRRITADELVQNTRILSWADRIAGF